MSIVSLRLSAYIPFHKLKPFEADVINTKHALIQSNGQISSTVRNMGSFFQACLQWVVKSKRLDLLLFNVKKKWQVKRIKN